MPAVPGDGGRRAAAAPKGPKIAAGWRLPSLFFWPLRICVSHAAIAQSHSSQRATPGSASAARRNAAVAVDFRLNRSVRGDAGDHCRTAPHRRCRAALCDRRNRLVRRAQPASDGFAAWALTVSPRRRRAHHQRQAKRQCSTAPCTPVPERTSVRLLPPARRPARQPFKDIPRAWCRHGSPPAPACPPGSVPHNRRSRSNAQHCHECSHRRRVQSHGQAAGPAYAAPRRQAGLCQGRGLISSKRYSWTGSRAGICCTPAAGRTVSGTRPDLFKEVQRRQGRGPALRKTAAAMGPGKRIQLASTREWHCSRSSGGWASSTHVSPAG